MANQGSADGADIARIVGVTADRMHSQLAVLSSFIQGSLEEEIPELRSDARLIDLLGASVEGNVDTLLHALRHEIPVERVEAPTAALEYARRLAQHGVSVNALVRAYRLGQRRMTEHVFREVRDLDVPPDQRIAVLEAITTTLFEYIDWVSQQVVTVYEGERERWLENQNSLRALRIREILAARQPIDVDAASTAVRYPLRWHHLGLVAWYPEVRGDADEMTRLQRFVRDLATAVKTAASPLLVAADQTSGWVWLPYRMSPTGVVAEVSRIAQQCEGAPSVAIGTVGAGLEGFRRTHFAALAAHGVAVAGGRPEPTVMSASEPGLAAAALLGADIDSARRWVGQVLGELAGDNENDARLRETLRVFLRCGSSHKLAAQELNLHFNTVKYRVGRAVERRGRPIADDRLDIEIALLVYQWYGAAANRPDPG
ncbi:MULTISPECIES: CdaR family transcriptional regulator [unclassified Mycolicibacterium]|uniref:PucR family transcriptional regulator n=1 Tax=unclassified Mycolicibacterium TaxID=2636767 RepID=UPI0012DF596D|nr:MULTISPECIES: helix-turn-helix domain-containing protein [unclassified Mycolicibacterium]MUL80246.1 PucR family transcriptional regulator [Mycolicibacterium sp. CBMA 329]MUL86013.1 PucR family transcriptional regulator [Mycolicibacterium sp. CBMA 331]MUM00787.1 PucR family transcriptional regulator [Mycolicibacterium sp. CBMA 334]MUM28209.1 PucR family transcriptional regulator [Mycolicibacterium sp. CBMA 295]MUM36309.1 PucR family transcriptional regulator [Mycolicibacterium sp. CBMA 247]